MLFPQSGVAISYPVTLQSCDFQFMCIQSCQTSETAAALLLYSGIPHSVSKTLNHRSYLFWVFCSLRFWRRCRRVSISEVMAIGWNKGVDVSRGPGVVGCPQRPGLSQNKVVNRRGVCCAGLLCWLRSLNLGLGTRNGSCGYFSNSISDQNAQPHNGNPRTRDPLSCCALVTYLVRATSTTLSWPTLLLFLLWFFISSPPMRSRIAGVLLSGYGVRNSSAFAFSLAAAAGSGGIRHTRTTEAAAASAPCRGGTATPGPSRLHHDPARSGFHVNHGRSSSSSLMSSVASTAEVGMGQDAGEMFDVFLPPKSLSAQTEPPVPAGFAKARGLVHADGDWHRSVHIWLHNSKVSLGAPRRSRLPGVIARRRAV